MEDTNEKPVWLVLLLVITSAGAGILIGTALGAGLASLFYQGDILQAMTNPDGDAIRIPMLIIQGMTTLCGFLLTPYLVWKTLRKNEFNYFNAKGIEPIIPVLVFFIVIFFIVADSAIIEWNQNIHFPDFLKSFEEWARAKEDQLAELTKLLTAFKTPGEFILAFIVVAVFAGICEEFLFRGIIQTELFKGTKNIHLAIWVSAFLFSAIHAQFFGFVPRMLLGALFGYLYYWSGNLIVPMMAHFINNGFAISMIYFYQLKIVSTDIDSTESAPWPAVIATAFLTGLLLYYFKKKSQTTNPSIA
jgi:hypothetical protein